jgi:carboxyl-terminal processing protease
MPRRNLYLLVILAVVCLMCAAQTSRYGSLLRFAMDQIDLRYLEDVDARDLFQGALEGMMSRLDEYSAYISPAMMAEFLEEIDKEFGGLGIEIILDPETKELLVASPLVGTPAYEAGILAGDKIVRIGDESTQGMSLVDAAKRMRGEPGTAVSLTVVREGETHPIDVEIVRAVIKVDTVLGDTRNPDGTWNYFLEGSERIGYLRINAFAEETYKELARIVPRLIDEGMRGLILDLRNDPGGLLDAGVGTCDLFVDSGVIVTTRNRWGRIRDKYEAHAEGTYLGFPMAVLVNQFSASASEIVAACLQDHGRAIVVGERTFGKGTVQELIELAPDQGMLKLTTASYWRPSGVNIHRHADDTDDDPWGVVPDEGYEVRIEPEALEKLFRARIERDRANRTNGEKPAPFEDPQREKAVEYLERKLRADR